MSNNGRKVRAVPECNHTQESRKCQVFLFPAIFAGSWFVEIQKFDYHGNVT